MSITDKLKNSKIAEFWLKHEQKIVLAIGIVLIATVSFEAGFLKGQQNKQEPIVVNKAACPPAGEAGVPYSKNETIATNAGNKTSDYSSQQSNQAKIEGQTLALADNQKCAFVASKNSNKYHLPTCRYAQNIKPENKVCFSSKEEAESRGFQGAKCCIK